MVTAYNNEKNHPVAHITGVRFEKSGQEERTEHMGESCSSCQIVLAEDNPADVGLVRAALQEHGVDYELHIIDDGAKALSFIDSLDMDSKIPCPDLLLLDLYLPQAVAAT